MLTHTAMLGGAEIALLRLARSLDPDRCRVQFVVFAEGPLPDRLRRQGCAVEVVTLDPAVATVERHRVGRLSSRTARGALGTATHVWRLQHRLRQMDADVVHANSLKAGVIGAVAARLTRRPLVWYVHDRISDDYLPRRTATTMRFAVRTFSRRVLCNSRATLATLGTLPSGRAAVAYPGLEPSAFADAVRPLPPEPLFGIVGRISPTKGQDVFLRAAARVAQQHPRARFVVVGAALFAEQDFEREVRALASSLGLADRVTFTGQVADVERYLGRLTAMVHASPVPEPFGQVVVEAMAAGVPVIATGTGGIPEIVDGGPDGMLGVTVAPGDDESLAAAMAQVLDDPQAADARARRALASARRRFPIDQTAQAVMTCWTEAAR